MKRESSTLEKNPVVRTAKWAVSMMKNKLIASLILLIQGILFIVSPAGNMQGMVQIGAAVVILACVINILLHLLQKKKTKLDYILSILNGAVIAACIYCLVCPQAIEPYVRKIVGIIMILTNAVNLIETLKVEKKKDWKFAVGVIASIVMMGLGVAMTFADELRIAFMQQSIGVFLILNALTNIWYIFRLRQTGK
jgi:uncharacterized membrane protein HdeD (DUF308 family)